MTSTVLSIDRRAGRWCVAADGEPLATAGSAEAALATAVEAVSILRRSGISADLSGPAPVASEPKSFDPADGG